MKKSTLILAGAIAFDLGVMVASSQAAVDMFLKIDGFQDGKKVAVFANSDACKAGGGAVVLVKDMPQCQLPSKKGGSGPAKDASAALQGVSTTR
jgi:hypothetical protein